MREKKRKEAEEEDKRKIEKKRKNILEEERQLKRMREEEEVKFDSASALLSEASERLQQAIKQKDFKQVALAQAMMQGVVKVQEEASQQRRSVCHKQTSIEKKKSTLLDFFRKKN